MISYAGIQQIERATYTLTHGVAPGYFEVDILPQQNDIPPIGTVIMAFNGVTIRVDNCKIDEGSYVLDDKGFVVALKIYDRRWRWLHGEIYGVWNKREPNGDILSHYRRSARQLAVDLFRAMGETRFDVSALPQNEFPSVSWNGDNPAQELDELCDNLGFAVVPQTNGSIVICKLGTGKSLPINAFTSAHNVLVDLADGPDYIRIVGEPTAVQCRLELEAVGRDIDGSIKPINQLSYTPVGGWGREPFLFPNVAALADKTALKNATETVWRWYQVRQQSGNLYPPITVPNLGTITTLRQILPLDDQLLETYIQDGVKKQKPAYVHGEFWKGNIGTPINSNFGDIYKGGFNILDSLGVVEFQDQVLRWVPSAEVYEPALLYLTTSFNVLRPDNNAFYRYDRLSRANQILTGAGTKSIPGEGLRGEIINGTGLTSRTLSNEWRLVTSISSLNVQADRLAAAERNKFVHEGTLDVTYNGFHVFELDGAIRQIQWSYDQGNGYETKACRNAETIPWIPTQKTRRVAASARHAAERKRRLVNLIRRAQREARLRRQNDNGMGMM